MVLLAKFPPIFMYRRIKICSVHNIEKTGVVFELVKNIRFTFLLN